ncbi:DUF3108 domain-containing protein [Neomegalonema sp.]|uniref:DUF3108 domain-containing protein n=1 Tax=Neomegalonema sp. TaxID=2039713 RepID=UPI0026339DB6|nr:DUF3108 domain-containing protein [Neomegalonema sp.]MDD2869859.1 DUF3108 domain-containing protein [Neomegalonema sp.]
MSFMKRRVAALTAALTLGLGAIPGLAQTSPGGDPPAGGFSYEFRVYLGGIPLGTLTARGGSAGGAYAAQGEFRMASLLAMVIDSDASAEASGRIGPEGRAIPERFSYRLRDRKESSELILSYDPQGRPLSIQRIPDAPKRDREPDPSEVPDAIDPATAIYLLGAPRVDPCAFDHQVFDGRKLHGVRLSGPARQEPDGSVVCQGLYERLKGFRDKDMTPERARHVFQARLTALPEGGWRPERIWADTTWGQASVLRR